MKRTERVDDIRVIPMAGPATDVLNTFEWRHERAPVKTSAGDCVERVSNRQDACAERDHIAFETRRIAAAVPALVMVTHERSDCRQR